MQRGTAQRRAILQALEDAPGPLTAQELHDRAREEVEGIGLATVYRNLGELERDGQVVAVHLPRDATRYDPQAGAITTISGACGAIPSSSSKAGARCRCWKT